MSTTTTAAPAAWLYENDQWTRDGQLIATMENGLPVFTEFGYKYKHVVLKRLKQAATPQVEAGVRTPPAVSANELKRETVPEVRTPTADPFSGLTAEQRECVVWLRKQEGLDPFHVEQRTGKPVKPDRIKGEKGKAFIADVFRYDPVGFCQLYGVLRFGRANRKVVAKDPQTGRMKASVQEVKVVLSVRKTYLTERVDSMAVIPEDVDQ